MYRYIKNINYLGRLCGFLRLFYQYTKTHLYINIWLKLYPYLKHNIHRRKVKSTWMTLLTFAKQLKVFILSSMSHVFAKFATELAYCEPKFKHYYNISLTMTIFTRNSWSIFQQDILHSEFLKHLSAWHYTNGYSESHDVLCASLHWACIIVNVYNCSLLMRKCVTFSLCRQVIIKIHCV